MKSNKFGYKIILLFICSLVMMGCKEELKTFVEENNPPVLLDFSPKSGFYGTEVSISGENLLSVDSVWIGGGLARLKYRIDDKHCVVVVTNECKSGVIRIKSSGGEDQTAESFTLDYLVPSIGVYPEVAQPNDEILIEGENLNAVTGVYFGATKANIISQDGKNLVVRVPYFEDSPVAISLEYFDGTNTKKVSTQDGAFTLNVPELIISRFPLEGAVNTTIDIVGENLNLVEKAMFGEYEGMITQRTSTSMKVTIPEAFTANAVVTLKLLYLGVMEKVLTDSFEVYLPDGSTIYYWENVTTQCQGIVDGNSFFSARTGEVYTPCDYENVKSKITFYASISSGLFQLNNPNNSENQTKNFKCKESGSSLNLPTEVMPVMVRFRTLNASLPEDKKYIDLVKAKSLEEISLDIIKADGVNYTTELSNTPRYPAAFDKGDVIMLVEYIVPYKTAPAVVGTADYSDSNIAKIGFIEVVNVNIDSTINNSDWTFNCYYQK